MYDHDQPNASRCLKWCLRWSTSWRRWSFLFFLFFLSFCFNRTYVSSPPSQPNTVLKVGIRERPLLVHCLSDTGIMCYQVFFLSQEKNSHLYFTKSMASGSATGDAGQTGRARGCLGLVPRTETWDHCSQVILILVMIVLLVVIDMIQESEGTLALGQGLRSLSQMFV